MTRKRPPTRRARSGEEPRDRPDDDTTSSTRKQDELQDWIDRLDTFVGEFDLNGVGLLFNEAPIKAGGVTRDEVVGRYFPDTPWWSHSETERARIVECLRRAKAGLSSRIETNFRSTDGSAVPIIFNCQPKLDADGNVEYITAEGKTIVEEVRLRDELQEAKESLEARVEEHTSELVDAIEKLEKEIAERKGVEERALRQHAVLESINRVFRDAVTCEAEEDMARSCLALVQDLTDSKFGFIGEVNASGRFDTIAVSDPGWVACMIPVSNALVMVEDMRIRGIWGAVLEHEQSLIINDPSSHPDRVGTPDGHPLLTSFLGVPLKRSGRTIGMIALANKELGYDQDDVQAVESLSVAFVETLMRRRAEDAHVVEDGLVEMLVRLQPLLGQPLRAVPAPVYVLQLPVVHRLDLPFELPQPPT